MCDIFSSLFLQDNQHPTPPRVSPPLQWEDVDSEEQQLRQKLHQMTDNISDHSLTSDDEESFRPLSSPEVPAWRSPQGDGKPSRTPTRSSSRTSTVNSKPEEEQTAAHKVEASAAEQHSPAISRNYTGVLCRTDDTSAVSIWSAT